MKTEWFCTFGVSISPGQVAEAGLEAADPGRATGRSAAEVEPGRGRHRGDPRLVEGGSALPLTGPARVLQTAGGCSEAVRGEGSRASKRLWSSFPPFCQLLVPVHHKQRTNVEASDTKLQDYEKQFDEWTPRKEELERREAELAAAISPDDAALLRQRLGLLRRDWDEIRHQLALRRARTEEQLGHWGSFDERHEDMLKWIDGMEEKAASTKDFNIEDLLHKIQTVRGVDKSGWPNRVSFYLFHCLVIYCLHVCRNIEMRSIRLDPTRNS